MSLATATAQRTVAATLTGRSRDRNVKSMVFLVALWFSLFFGIVVLLALIIDTVITGAPRFDMNLITNYESRLYPEETGFRAGILGSIWLMAVTALLAIPLGIAAAVHLEEFANSRAWYNRVAEINLQNLAAVPAIIYGMLAVAIMGLLGYTQKGIVLGGAIALALLILPVVVITTREAVRAVPDGLREAGFGVGATRWEVIRHHVLPYAAPGILTGTVLALARALGEAAPLILVGAASGFLTTGDSYRLGDLQERFTALPQIIATWAGRPVADWEGVTYAAIAVLLAIVLLANATAILLRNRYEKKRA